MSELDHNFQSSRHGVDNTKPSKVYSEALENKVLSSSKTNADLFVEIFQDSFHEWINVPLKSDDKEENTVKEEKIQDAEEKVGFFKGYLERISNSYRNNRIRMCIFWL